jgi:hypothetical protein
MQLIKEDRGATAKICVSYFDEKNMEQFIGKLRVKLPHILEEKMVLVGTKYLFQMDQ